MSGPEQVRGEQPLPFEPRKPSRPGRPRTRPKVVPQEHYLSVSVSVDRDGWMTLHCTHREGAGEHVHTIWLGGKQSSSGDLRERSEALLQAAQVLALCVHSEGVLPS